jgi:hypothetical protein
MTYTTIRLSRPVMDRLKTLSNGGSKATYSAAIEQLIEEYRKAGSPDVKIRYRYPEAGWSNVRLRRETLLTLRGLGKKGDTYDIIVRRLLKFKFRSEEIEEPEQEGAVESE